MCREPTQVNRVKALLKMKSLMKWNELPDGPEKHMKPILWAINAKLLMKQSAEMKRPPLASEKV